MYAAAVWLYWTRLSHLSHEATPPRLPNLKGNTALERQT
jgi:hypothetical protein